MHVNEFVGCVYTVRVKRGVVGGGERERERKKEKEKQFSSVL